MVAEEGVFGCQSQENTAKSLPTYCLTLTENERNPAYEKQCANHSLSLLLIISATFPHYSIRHLTSS